MDTTTILIIVLILLLLGGGGWSPGGAGTEDVRDAPGIYRGRREQPRLFLPTGEGETWGCARRRDASGLQVRWASTSPRALLAVALSAKDLNVPFRARSTGRVGRMWSNSMAPPGVEINTVPRSTIPRTVTTLSLKNLKRVLPRRAGECSSRGVRCPSPPAPEDLPRYSR